ncbi:hypothetical protein SLS62_000637 [Diatrype stigma]|uniref:Uncharacterized protein n=1 Tax=Diatrype stigma TaxID=117547 RepID=A0AAN9YWW3_9PEZI
MASSLRSRRVAPLSPSLSLPPPSLTTTTPAIALAVAAAKTMPHLDTIIIGGPNPVEGKVVSVPTHEVIDDGVEEKDKARFTVGDNVVNDSQEDALGIETKGGADGDTSLPVYDGKGDRDGDSEDAIIITGADAARYLLPLRDDFEPVLTFRSLFLATCFAAFQAVMKQIYYVSKQIDMHVCMHDV